VLVVALEAGLEEASGQAHAQLLEVQSVLEGVLLLVQVQVQVLELQAVLVEAVVEELQLLPGPEAVQVLEVLRQAEEPAAAAAAASSMPESGRLE
jgi:hypothetical protein